MVVSTSYNLCAAWDQQYKGIRSSGPGHVFTGWRKDVCPDAAAVVRPLQTLIRNPVDLTSSYRGFLKISHPYDWSGVGCFYVGASLEYISGIACRCACNPYVVCPVHPCKCEKCGHDGLQCMWRSQLQRMLEKEKLLSQAAGMEGKMTYIHSLEMPGGEDPRSQEPVSC